MTPQKDLTALQRLALRVVSQWGTSNLPDALEEMRAELERQLAQKPYPRPRVLLEIEGGNIERCLTDSDLEVLVYDWDNIEADAEKNPDAYPAEPAERSTGQRVDNALHACQSRAKECVGTRA